MLSMIALPIKHLSIKMGWTNLVLDGNWKSQIPVKGNFIKRLGSKLENIKISVENRTNNYFPFYEQLNASYHHSNRALNSLIYKELIPSGTNTDLEYTLKKGDAYYINSSMASSKIEERVEKHAELYNQINKIKPVYIYLPHRFEFQESIANNDYRNMYDYVKLFKDKLDKSIKTGELKVNSLEEYNQMFFKTDHHWTCEGASKAYKEIMDMLGNSSNKVYNCEKVDGKYLGSFANRFKDQSGFDEFSYLKTNFKYDLDYRLMINDKMPDEKYKPKVLDAKKRDVNPFYDYYIGFYYGFYGRVVYNFNNDNEKLLIIADSYSWAIDDLIASSFSETHIINLMFDEYQDGKFNYKDYIRRHNIDKVLILQETPTTMYDVFDHGILTKVVK